MGLLVEAIYLRWMVYDVEYRYVCVFAGSSLVDMNRRPNRGSWKLLLELFWKALLGLRLHMVDPK